MDPMDLKTKLRSIGFDADENGQSRQVQHQIPINLPPFLGICGVIFAYKRPRGSLCFCTSRLAARLPARIAAPGKTRRVFNTVALFHFLLYVLDGLPNSKVRALADLCAHSSPPP